MVEAHRFGGQHGGQPLPLGRQAVRFVAMAAPEVGSEHLDRRPRAAAANGGHGGCEQAGAVVGQIVTGHGREHHIGELEAGHRRGHPLRLSSVERSRGLALVHLAEGAAAGADRPPQQEGGRAGGIALGPVGAAALLADRMQSPLFDHPLHGLQLGSSPDGTAQPGRQPLFGGNGAVAGWGAHSTARRPSKARARVTSSAYSSSLPTGRP